MKSRQVLGTVVRSLDCPRRGPECHYLSKPNDREWLDLRPVPNSEFLCVRLEPFVGYPTVKSTAPARGETGAVVSTGVFDVPRLRGLGTEASKQKKEIGGGTVMIFGAVLELVFE
jgi:hypothetical protein